MAFRDDVSPPPAAPAESSAQAVAGACRDLAPGLFRLAYGILGDRHLAEDVCQQALLKVHQRQEAVQSLASWLSRVVVHESFTLLRRRRVERSARPALAAAQASRESVDPGADLIRREAVAAALADLSPQTRDVVVMRLMLGMSGNEVSQQLRCSASEVSRRLHQGMEQLRVTLGDGRGGA